jgi:hypothetical protein
MRGALEVPMEAVIRAVENTEYQLDEDCSIVRAGQK